MGVMSCYREGCDNIMCDVYVDGVGYVCHECEDEFNNYLVKTGINPETEGEIRVALKGFMNTRKGDYETGNNMDTEEFFNQYRRK